MFRPESFNAPISNRVQSYDRDYEIDSRKLERDRKMTEDELLSTLDPNPSKWDLVRMRGETRRLDDQHEAEDYDLSTEKQAIMLRLYFIFREQLNQLHKKLDRDNYATEEEWQDAVVQYREKKLEEMYKRAKDERDAAKEFLVEYHDIPVDVEREKKLDRERRMELEEVQRKQRYNRRSELDLLRTIQPKEQSVFLFADTKDRELPRPDPEIRPYDHCNTYALYKAKQSAKWGAGFGVFSALLTGFWFRSVWPMKILRCIPLSIGLAYVSYHMQFQITMAGCKYIPLSRFDEYASKGSLVFHRALSDPLGVKLAMQMEDEERRVMDLYDDEDDAINPNI
eukprot:TRINITY_DN19255_c0_g1_i1.p1 TRINITY_DN19255_c0_g1~~TRINITY_DN19255_c0_g1_i1.p1  ORF type:complete len:339 (-),score=70.65 TRINITY_DN19255_c0_g1_i1:62-1078(-)